MSEPSKTPLRDAKRIDEPVSIVMPVFNERETIETALSEFVEVVYRYLPEGSEFLIDEGGSDDGTPEVLAELQQRWPFLAIVCKKEREGAWAALQSLILRAKAPWIFVVDSDGQCVAEEFWKLAPHMKEYDFVLGAKRVRLDPFYRRGGSLVFNRMMTRLFGIRHRDINFSFRLGRREPFQECARRYEILPNLFNAETTIWAHVLGYRIKEIEVAFRARVYGASRCFPARTWLFHIFRSYRAVGKLKRKIDAEMSQKKQA